MEVWVLIESIASGNRIVKIYKNEKQAMEEKRKKYDSWRFFLERHVVE